MKQINAIVRSKKLKTLLTLLAILFLTGLLLYVFHAPILTGLASILVANDDNLQPADIIFVLTGDVNSRPFYAAELYHQGLAPKIVIAKEEDLPAVQLGLYPNTSDVVVDIMTELGVPAQNVVHLQIEGGVTSTRDEAVLLRDYIESRQIERVILVTTAFHTRRSRWMFEKALGDLPVTLQVAAAPQWKFDQTNWWQRENGLLTFANEYLKLAYYLAVY